MPLRYYECDCGNYFSVFQPMMEELLTVCPNCEGKLYQDLGGITTAVKQYNTIGSMAEKNAKDLGIYGREIKEQEMQQELQSIRTKKDKILEDRGINVLKGKQMKVSEKAQKLVNSGDKKAIQRYIITGE